MTEHVVAWGDCLTSIAAKYGFASIEPLVAANRELLAIRHPSVLHPGDRVAIPPRRTEAVVAAPGRHTFSVGRPRARVRMRLEDAQRRPLAGARYALRVAGVRGPIKTTPDGSVDEELDPEVTDATLELLGAGDRVAVVLRLRVGKLLPAHTFGGCQQRLDNLGLVGHVGAICVAKRDDRDETMLALAALGADDRDVLQRALERFRALRRVAAPEVAGFPDRVDPQTQRALEDAHGG